MPSYLSKGEEGQQRSQVQLWPVPRGSTASAVRCRHVVSLPRMAHFAFTARCVRVVAELAAAAVTMCVACERFTGDCVVLKLRIFCVLCFPRFKDHPTLNDRYLLLHLLGRGGFSEVYKVSVRNWAQRRRIESWLSPTWRKLGIMVIVGCTYLLKFRNF